MPAGIAELLAEQKINPSYLSLEELKQAAEKIARAFLFL